MITTRIEEDRNVALYNANKKELIGLFSLKCLAEKYLYMERAFKVKNGNRITKAIMTKGKIMNSRFDFPVAVRYTNEKQDEMLGSEDYLIVNGYPEPLKVQMNYYKNVR